MVSPDLKLLRRQILFSPELLVLSMEQASCDPSGAQNLEGGSWMFGIFVPPCISAYAHCLTLNIPRGVLRGPPLVCYWLTSVEINKHKVFDTNDA